MKKYRYDVYIFPDPSDAKKFLELGYIPTGIYRTEKNDINGFTYYFGEPGRQFYQTSFCNIRGFCKATAGKLKFSQKSYIELKLSEN